MPLRPWVAEHREMAITAKWVTGSALVAVVLPVEIWLILPDEEVAYSFMEYHRKSPAAQRPPPSGYA
ncbi:hypothetical protein G6O67_008719 [Ophiocordyceps sinensis]|uniref:Uncharacterized protein n=2 Tax=Ophiocordyceps sinensis TaxID=72228 RepID=A0A8H4LS23_9HYPO|nr:hypothetical protein OCS_05586 [Ophiocordyceps sinensis CO18]KAF4504106.1 hypothetical protein G6O67_008719 [Ophiocordyceps sinensis]